MSFRILSHTQTHTFHLTPFICRIYSGLTSHSGTFVNIYNAPKQHYSETANIFLESGSNQGNRCLVDYQTFGQSAVMCHQSVKQSKWWPNDNLIKNKNAGRVLLIIITNSSTKKYSGVVNNLMFSKDRWLQLVQVSFHSWSGMSKVTDIRPWVILNVNVFCVGKANAKCVC